MPISFSLTVITMTMSNHYKQIIILLSKNLYKEFRSNKKFAELERLEGIISFYTKNNLRVDICQIF